MKLSSRPRQFEFFHQHPENFLLVQSAGEEVTIRAAFDNFSERRKRMFIRELAAEGFIPDCYERISGMDETFGGVRWVIDSSWVAVNRSVTRTADRLCARVLIGASLLLLMLLATIFSGPSQRGRAAVQNPPARSKIEAGGHTQGDGPVDSNKAIRH